MLQWTIDPEGRILGPRFHDGELRGIFADEDAVRIMVTNLDRASYVISLAESQFLNVQSFWRGNIVNTVFLFEKAHVREEYWRDLFEDQVAIRSSLHLAELILGLSQRFMLVIESSYGARVFATCNGMDVAAVPELGWP